MVDAPILDELHEIADWDAASDFEKKHTPRISLEKVEDRYRVTFEVGREVPHPNQPDHFIEWVDVYANDAPIARVELSAVAAWPKGCVEVSVNPGDTVWAVENCNLHGRWKSYEQLKAE